jgi:hydroxymethylpyrimidine pyrophosphatase-like HAD family hydrolase
MARGFDFTVRPLRDSNGTSRFSKIMCVSDSPAALAELAHAVSRIPIEAALSLPTVLELNPGHINKASGVTELLEHLCLADQPFYAVGDGENDLPLFRRAERSFAPATAPEGIKTVASQVIDVSRDGLLAPILRTAA